LKDTFGGRSACILSRVETVYFATRLSGKSPNLNCGGISPPLAKMRALAPIASKRNVICIERDAARAGEKRLYRGE
jgi:hypothetical protein